MKTLQYMITQNCNSPACKHCMLWVKKVNGELSFNEFKQLFDNPHQFKNIDVTGGEPFLRDDINQHFEYLSKQKIDKLSITTNGILQDRIIEAAKTSINSNVKYKFWLSFDGMEEQNDFMRSKGAFDKSMNTLESLLFFQNHNFRIGISTTLNDYNSTAFPAMQQFFGAYGLDLKSINVPNVSNFYSNKKNKYTSLAPEHVPEHINHRDAIVQYLKTGDTKYQCSSPQNKLVLDSFGNIRACSQQWTDDFVVGNIREHDYDLNKLLEKNADKYAEVCRRASIKDCNKCFTICEYSSWSSMHNDK